MESIKVLNESLVEELFDQVNQMLAEDLEDCEYLENLEELNNKILSHVKQVKKLHGLA